MGRALHLGLYLDCHQFSDCENGTENRKPGLARKRIQKTKGTQKFGIEPVTYG